MGIVKGLGAIESRERWLLKRTLRLKRMSMANSSNVIVNVIVFILRSKRIGLAVLMAFRQSGAVIGVGRR